MEKLWKKCLVENILGGKKFKFFLEKCLKKFLGKKNFCENFFLGKKLLGKILSEKFCGKNVWGKINVWEKFFLGGGEIGAKKF